MQPSQLIYLHKGSGQISSKYVCDDGDLAEPQPIS